LLAILILFRLMKLKNYLMATAQAEYAGSK
jgi:hypothetical protein